MPDIHSVTVLGTGVLGSRIALQAAFHDFDVTAYDVSDDALDAARDRFARLAEAYRRDGVPGAEEGRADAASARIRLTTDLAAAVADADLVIEAVPESIDIKRETYARLAEVAPESAIFATNSSTLLPSDLKDATGRPDRFLALHYANQVWRQNTAEIMGTADTDPAVVEAVTRFAEDSGLVPIVLKKEKAGYVLNSLLVPLLNAAAGLLIGGYADVETVDRTWRIATGAPAGPFQIFDVIGLNTAYQVAAAGTDDGSKLFAAYLKDNYLDHGKLGVATEEGFYRY